MKKALALVLAALALILPVPTADAARPSHDATLVVAPAAPVVGDSLVFTGCGYEPGIGVILTVESPGATSFFGDIADADGCINSAETELYIAQVPGEYTARSFECGSYACLPRHRRADVTLVFTVQ